MLKYLLVSIGLMISSMAIASHGLGSDVTYTCISAATNTYQISIKFYRDCSGIPVATPVVNVRGTCGTINLTTPITLLPGYPVEVSQACSSAPTTCTTGSLPGVEEYIYQGTVSIPDGCDSVILFYAQCCRGNSITNISGATTRALHIETVLTTDEYNDPAVDCNSSPTFSFIPVLYACSGQTAYYNHGAFDPDGDSLSFSLIDPKTSTSNTAPFVAGLSATRPLNVTGNFEFDSATGQMKFTPVLGQQQVASVAIRVEEYRNGVRLGYTIREVLVVVLNNCGNVAPFTGVDSLTVNAGGKRSGATIYTCPGNQLDFTLNANDIDLGDTLSAETNLTATLPGAVVTVTGINPIAVRVIWSVPVVPQEVYNLTIKVQDNACPLRAVQIVGFRIIPQSLVDIVPNDTILCSNDLPNSLQLIADAGTDVGSYSWSPATNLSNTNTRNPVVNTIANDITYTCTFTNSTGIGCVSIDSVAIKVNQVQMNIAPLAPEFCPGDTPLQFNAQMLVAGQLAIGQDEPYTTRPTNALPTCSTVSGGDHSIVFGNNVPDATGDVSFTFCLLGDFSLVTTESVTLFGEGGVNLGTYNQSTANTSLPDCGFTSFCNTVTISRADWNVWNNDGQVVLTIDANNNVNSLCDTATGATSGSISSCVMDAYVDYIRTGGTDNVAFVWSPATDLSAATIANPIATPSSPRVYTCTASDGICEISRSLTVSCAILPVHCINLNAVEQDKEVHLTWELALEQSNAGFWVERSRDGIEFEHLAWIPSRGDSQNQQEYTFTDTKAQAGNDYYYRIKQIDLDGQRTYVCTMVHIRTKGEAVQYLQVYPNPTQDVVTLSYYTDIKTTMDIQLLDVLGKNVLAVRYESLELGSNQHQISLAELPKGVYLLQISHSDHVYQSTRRIVKQ